MKSTQKTPKREIEKARRLIEDFRERSSVEKKIFPTGESWGEYRKKHYTVEEITENGFQVKPILF